MANAPFPWNPSNQSNLGSDIPGASSTGFQVGSGDWIQLFVSYRNTNVNPVVYAPGQFLVHCVYTPNSDDAMPHEDQSTTYGGPVNGSAGANRRRNFHVDPNCAFQAPWDGQVSVIAGGQSAPDVMCDVLIARGHTPRDPAAAARLFAEGEELMSSGTDLGYQAGSWLKQMAMRAPHSWAQPVIGTPQLVPSTYIGITHGIVIPFTDGVVKMSTVYVALGATAPATMAIQVMGNAITVDLASGIPIDVGMIAQGGQCTNGVRATWSPSVDLKLVTLWTSLGG
jgi:hypothetical protein